MTERIRTIHHLRRPALVTLAAVTTMLIVSIAGAADRVVLGEYFTNLH